MMVLKMILGVLVFKVEVGMWMWRCLLWKLILDIVVEIEVGNCCKGVCCGS